MSLPLTDYTTWSLADLRNTEPLQAGEVATLARLPMFDEGPVPRLYSSNAHMCSAAHTHRITLPLLSEGSAFFHLHTPQQPVRASS